MSKKKDNRRRSSREGASQRLVGWRDQWRGWIHHHRHSAADSLHRLIDQPLSSVVIWLVIGIALALPMGMQVALDNLRLATADWDSGSRISLFLEESASDQRGQEISRDLASRETIAETAFVSRQQALEEFRQLSGFGEVLGQLDRNPLPHLVVVTPRAGLTNDQTRALADELDEIPGVQQVVVDMEWIQRLQTIMDLGHRLAYALGGVLIVGVLLILGNTIRLTIESRREEIVVIKLVGGSNAFVRRPLLYTGLWYGVGGGLMAWLAVSAAVWYLQGPASQLSGLYDSGFTLTGVGLVGGLELTLIGGALGLVGSWLSVSRHIRAIEPT